MQDFFGPLGKENCTYFYFFSIAGFIVMIMFILFTLMILLRFHKKVNPHVLMNLIVMIINSFFLYFSNRLLYTMCMKSL
jgi:hypothetical protein